MRFIPGTHKLCVIEHKHLEDFRVEDENVDYGTEITVPLKAGSCSFHHSLAIHRTAPHRIRATTAESKYIGKPPQPDYDLVAGRAFEGCVDKKAARGWENSSITLCIFCIRGGKAGLWRF